MTYFDDLISKLFPKKTGENRIVLNEVIKRSENYQVRYNKWTDKEAGEAIRKVAESYYQKKQNEENPGTQVHLLESKYSNGFAVSYNTRDFTPETFTFLFDNLAERIKALPYYKHVNSDVLITEKNTFVETREKHYLKPRATGEHIMNQRFGNILIEHIINDQTPVYIKFISNIYSDSNYNTPGEFRELVEILFS